MTPEEAPVEAATQTQTARFVSKGRNLRLILLNPLDHPHPITGTKTVDQIGFTVEFSRQPFAPVQDDSDGSFEWPYGEDLGAVGESGYPVYVDPVSGAEVDVVKEMREHTFFDVQFVELGPDPEVLIAEQNALLGEIQRAAVGRDAERLAEIYDAEMEGNKRGPVLTASMEALRAVEDALASEREPVTG